MAQAPVPVVCTATPACRSPRAGTDSGCCASARRGGDEAENELRAALEIQEREWGEDDPRLSRTFNGLAMVARRRDETEAIALYGRAIELDRLRPTSPDIETAIAVQNLGTSLAAVGRHEEAETRYLEALEIQGQVGGDRHTHRISDVDRSLRPVRQDEATRTRLRPLACQRTSSPSRP